MNDGRSEHTPRSASICLGVWTILAGLAIRSSRPVPSPSAFETIGPAVDGCLDEAEPRRLFDIGRAIWSLVGSINFDRTEPAIADEDADWDDGDADFADGDDDNYDFEVVDNDY